MGRVHASAIIDSSAKIDDYAIIGECVQIGAHVTVGPYAVLEHVTIGEGAKIYPGAILGKDPQDLSYSGQKSRVVIGKNTIVREYATVERGSLENGATVVGENCLLMNYSHIGHDSHLGNGVIIVNAVQLSGHVKVADGAILTGLCGIHQYVSIGRYVLLKKSAIVKNIPPFCICEDNILRGLNKVGLERNGFSKKEIRILSSLYRELFLSKIATLKKRLALIMQKERSSYEMEFIDFVQNHSTESGRGRGICLPKYDTQISDEDQYTT